MGVIGEGPGGGASIFPRPHTDHGRVMHPPGKLESGWVGEYVALSTSGRDVLLSCAGAWILVRMRVVVFGAVQSLAPPQRRLLGVNCV